MRQSSSPRRCRAASRRSASYRLPPLLCPPRPPTSATFDRIELTGETAAQRRAAEQSLELAEHAAPALSGPDGAVWLEQLDAQSGGVEAALDWARRSGEAELALRLATAYAPVWFLRGRVTDGRRWLEAALLARARVPSHLVVRALREASLFARVQGQYETAHRLARVALHTAAGLPRPVLAAVALDAGELAARRGALASAESLDARSHALAAGDALAAARAECELAEVALLRGDADEARARGERALERQHQLEDE